MKRIGYPHLGNIRKVIEGKKEGKRKREGEREVKKRQWRQERQKANKRRIEMKWVGKSSILKSFLSTKLSSQIMLIPM